MEVNQSVCARWEDNERVAVLHEMENIALDVVPEGRTFVHVAKWTGLGAPGRVGGRRIGASVVLHLESEMTIRRILEAVVEHLCVLGFTDNVPPREDVVDDGHPRGGSGRRLPKQIGRLEFSETLKV